MIHWHFSHLFHRHQRDVHRFILSRVSCEATAADLTQETFLRVSQLPDLQSIRNMRSYLFRIATNLTIDHLRTQSRWQRVFADEETDPLDRPDSASTPESAFLAKEELKRIVETIQHLTPLCREIFLLNRYEGLPHREIAERLNVCISTVEKNIARALNQCRRCLNDESDASPNR